MHATRGLVASSYTTSKLLPRLATQSLSTTQPLWNAVDSQQLNRIPVQSLNHPISNLTQRAIRSRTVDLNDSPRISRQTHQRVDVKLGLFVRRIRWHICVVVVGHAEHGSKALALFRRQVQAFL